jgi:phage tail-like protein
MIPARNNYWLLDSVAAPNGQFGNGWQIATKDNGVSFTPLPDVDITLDPSPGKATFMSDSLGICFVCPVALAAGPNGSLFVIDAATDRITALDLSAQRTKRIASVGGTGAALRHFRTPRSITVLRSGAIAVADTGNRRVQLFSSPPYVLLQVWGGPELNLKPCAVANDQCGIIYVVDGESRSVLRVRASGGSWLDPIGAGTLQDPVELAVAADQTVAVVDGRGDRASIVIFPADGGKPVRLTLVAAPLCLAFDPSGNLYAGTANAVVSKIQPDSTQLSGWSLGGEGVSDADGSITKLVWVQGQGLIGILNSPTPGVAPRLFSMDPAGSYRLSGSFTTNQLDSKIETCSWHRIQVNGSIPEGASIAISSRTSEEQTSWTPFVPCAVLNGNKVDSLVQKDCLVQSPPGRYLQVTFTLQSTGAVTPQIHSIQVFFPRQSYLQYLPAVFQDDDQSRLFLDRFLSIFQTTFDGCDALLDNLWQLFDPNLTPDNVLPWLAAWVALPVDPASATPLRKLLKNAYQTYVSRGTVAGLQQAIQDYSGVPDIRMLEHFRLRNWTFLPVPAGLNQGARLWSPNFYARLQVGVSSTVGSFQLTNAPTPEAEPYTWGANQFSVLFPTDPYTVSNTAKAVQTVVDREKPAHTQAFLWPIFPRLRVGVQATLGVDAYVGKANAIVLGKLATLNYDSVLAPSQRERDIRALGLSPYPRLGNDARIL